MNKKQQTTFDEILDELIYASNDVRIIIENILEYENKEVPPELIEARHYCEDKVDKLRLELKKLITPTHKRFNLKTFMICIGWFWAIVLSVIAMNENNVLMAGVAAIFPFLIYLVRAER